MPAPATACGEEDDRLEQQLKDQIEKRRKEDRLGPGHAGPQPAALVGLGPRA